MTLIHDSVLKLLKFDENRCFIYHRDFPEGFHLYNSYNMINGKKQLVSFEHHEKSNVSKLFAYDKNIIVYISFMNTRKMIIKYNHETKEYIKVTHQERVMSKICKACISHNKGLMGPHKLRGLTREEVSYIHLMAGSQYSKIITRVDPFVLATSVARPKYYEVLFSNLEDLMGVCYTNYLRGIEGVILRSEDGELNLIHNFHLGMFPSKKYGDAFHKAIKTINEDRAYLEEYF